MSSKDKQKTTFSAKTTGNIRAINPSQVASNPIPVSVPSKRTPGPPETRKTDPILENPTPFEKVKAAKSANTSMPKNREKPVEKVTKKTGYIVADDSILLIDPIHILPGEECKCGRPKTDFERMGIKTYGDYLKKCCIRGKISNPYGKSIKFAVDKPGLGIVLHNYDKSINNGYTVEYEKSKTNPSKIGRVIINFDI